MDQHLKPLLIKIAMVTVLMLMTISLFSDYTAGNTILLSLLIAITSYFAIDVWFLSQTNNTWTTAADFLYFTFMISIVAPLIFGSHVFFLLAVQAAMVLVVGEWLFHLYMVRNVLKKPETTKWT